ncbi:hypothetical protein J2S03_002638 [Alicyclobacillus cycloheptanicus]|uniref:Uncharacterized protein n=1 Tax=Alicyclobacillus cycloheptanicus TaxID=1457 RepID=A0ABT9XM45_9BACL|nr:hypothetical protein [Alicyclobacillus cycloheptanicus]
MAVGVRLGLGGAWVWGRVDRERAFRQETRLRRRHPGRNRLSLGTKRALSAAIPGRTGGH